MHVFVYVYACMCLMWVCVDVWNEPNLKTRLILGQMDVKLVTLLYEKYSFYLSKHKSCVCNSQNV